MSRASYTVGQEIELSVEFKDDADDFTDPSTVTLIRKNPAGTESSHVYGVDGGVLKSATGRYTYKMTATTNAEKGRWHYRWKGTGALIAADESEFDVTPTAFATP
jgi:hypothetical protein